MGGVLRRDHAFLQAAAVIFEETAIPGLLLIRLEPLVDERGSFARTFCAREFAEHGLDPTVVQCNTSFNAHSGTLRGMHYQAAPHGEAKLVRCVRGMIYDVVVDLRPDSPTYTKWVGTELSEDSLSMFYIPAGLAHGFQTLVDDSEVIYQMSEYYSPEHTRGVRWDDPAFEIGWPKGPQKLSERDASYPDFVP